MLFFGVLNGKKRVNISSWNRGVYTVEIDYGNKRSHKKLLVE
jgi:hypothetical protein